MRGVPRPLEDRERDLQHLEKPRVSPGAQLGHGDQNLSVVLALLMMLAFLVDQVQQPCCPLFQAAWYKMKTKRHLWEEIRNHFRTLLFDSMAELLSTLIRGIAPQKLVFENVVVGHCTPRNDACLCSRGGATSRSRCAITSRKRRTTAEIGLVRTSQTPISSPFPSAPRVRNHPVIVKMGKPRGVTLKWPGIADCFSRRYPPCRPPRDGGL